MRMSAPFNFKDSDFKGEADQLPSKHYWFNKSTKDMPGVWFSRYILLPSSMSFTWLRFVVTEANFLFTLKTIFPAYFIIFVFTHLFGSTVAAGPLLFLFLPLLSAFLIGFGRFYDSHESEGDGDFFTWFGFFILCLTLPVVLDFALFFADAGLYSFLFTVSNPLYMSVPFTIFIDRLTIVFLVLTAALVLMIANFYFPDGRTKESFFFILLAFLQFFLTLTFMVRDLFLFYISFEGVLIPMLLMVGIWGSRPRKIYATYKFVLFTLFGSFIILTSILYIYLVTGSTDISYVKLYSFTDLEQKFLWLALFLGFAVKVPIFPFHSWLPEAHVEASTAGSVMLAGILLKLGGYGILRFNLDLFEVGFESFRPFALLLCAMSVLYASCLALSQTDVKKIVAYSSIAHMNLAIIGLLIQSNLGLLGSLFSMVSHGITSAALFLCAGELYGKYGTRHLGYYGGLAEFMPTFTFFFFMFILGNIALPGTSAFIGEFLVFSGTIAANLNLALIIAPQIVLTAAYSIWFYNRVVFGPRSRYIVNHVDFTMSELNCLFVFFVALIVLGIKPTFLLSYFSAIDLPSFLFVNVDGYQFTSSVAEKFDIMLGGFINDQPLSILLPGEELHKTFDYGTWQVALENEYNFDLVDNSIYSDDVLKMNEEDDVVRELDPYQRFKRRFWIIYDQFLNN